MFFVYGAENSKACDKTEFLLYTMHLDYRMYIFGRDYTLKQLHKLVPHANTVPHVYHGAKYIGGVKDLYNYLNSNEVISDYKRESERMEGLLKIPTDRSTGKGTGDVHEK